MEFLGILWDEVFMRPMINSLTLLYDVLFDSFGLSIIVFTVLMRVSDDPAAGAPDATDDEDAGTAAEDEGAAGQVQGQEQGGEAATLFRDHAPLPRGRGQPHRLSRPAGSPDAHLDSALSGDSAVRSAHPGGPCQPVGGVLLVESGAGHRSAGQPVRRDGPGRLRPVRTGAAQLRATRARRRFHVGTAEDDDAHDDRPAAATDEPDHALDDAGHVRVLYPSVPSRFGHLHPFLKPDWGGNPVLHRWQATNNVVRQAIRSIWGDHERGRTRNTGAKHRGEQRR